MSHGRRKVSFEGLLQENVLGTFTVIRGFAASGGSGFSVVFHFNLAFGIK